MGYSRSRAKCVPLQYPSSATRGVKQALCISNLSLNPNLCLSTPLQEKKLEKNSNIINQEHSDQVSQSESGMYYELLNRKKMECEKYQDCSWFQENSMKLDSCKDLMSQAEIFDSFIDADEFAMPMQFSVAHTSPWEDEYFEVFKDDILEENHKLKEKKFTSNENFYDSCGGGDNFNTYSIDFSLKKSDSMDSIKNISLTNPSEVIPITYNERVNNPNYELSKLNRIKNEIKEELNSPNSNVHSMDSDDSDLNIGREEEVEEVMITEDIEMVDKAEAKSLDEIKFEGIPPVNEKPFEIKRNSEEKSRILLPVKTENGSNKFDLNLDISKLAFEPLSNVNTPDLDFMDLVDFINEEMRAESNTTDTNSVPKTTISQKKDTCEDITTMQHHSTPNTPVTNLQTTSNSQDQPVSNSSEVTNSVADVADNSTVDLNALSTVSIAERIKTNADRRTRKNLRDLIDSEDEESSESSDEDYDDRDKDYDYEEDLVKRRSVPAKRRTKSNSVRSSTDGKKEEVDSYREKRDKNNEASRRSRQNRKARERHMYETLEEEERRNVKLKAEADVLEKQVASLRQLLLQVVLRKGGTT